MPRSAVPRGAKLSRAELLGDSQSQAVPSRAEPGSASLSRAVLSRAVPSRAEPALPPRLQQEALPGAATPAPGPRAGVPHSLCQVPGSGGWTLARLLPPAPLARQQSNSGGREEPVLPRCCARRAADGCPGGRAALGAGLSRAGGLGEASSARRRGPGQPRPLWETSRQVGMGRGAGAAASLPLLAALALLLAGGSPALPGAARAQLSAGE